jgi:transcriptional regulator of arginine metabolism
MSKRTRQQAVLEIVAERRPPNQAALAVELERRGFAVTQATLSRDIAELGLVKSKAGYLRPEDAPQNSKSQPADSRGAIRRQVVKVIVAQNLVVIRTAVGGAQSVGLALDDCARPELLGTIAGDDTVLVVTADRRAAGAFATWLLELIG